MTKADQLRELNSRAIALTGTMQGRIITNQWDLVFSAAEEMIVIWNEVRLLIDQEPVA